MSAPRTAALFGDSIAISWLPALRDVLEPWALLLSSMGRGLSDDPVAFVAAAAAGRHAAALLP
ncbi:MAG: hypothetical protein KY442_03435 [Proteobacteria bacterium]|nr:hypothetical protein [Pseudomonadota bacterium]